MWSSLMCSTSAEDFVLFLYVISLSHIYRWHSLRSSPSRLQTTLLHFTAVSLCLLHGSFNKAESSLSSRHATVCLLNFLRIVWDSRHEILCFYMLPTILKDKFGNKRINISKTLPFRIPLCFVGLFITYDSTHSCIWSKVFLNILRPFTSLLIVGYSNVCH